VLAAPIKVLGLAVLRFLFVPAESLEKIWRPRRDNFKTSERRAEGRIGAHFERAQINVALKALHMRQISATLSGKPVKFANHESQAIKATAVGVCIQGSSCESLRLGLGSQHKQDDPRERGFGSARAWAVKDGVATFSELPFRLPGALARLHGTFDLTTEKVDLQGMLFMDAELPQATSGMKSLVQKAIDPFLRRTRGERKSR
jgi:hypothetical protein